MAEGLRFAIPITNGRLSSHFGHCESFAIIDTIDGVISDVNFLNPPPHEPGVLPRWLKSLGVDIVIAGGMGIRAQNLLQQMGIEVIVGAPEEDPRILVDQYLKSCLRVGENLCDH